MIFILNISKQNKDLEIFPFCYQGFLHVLLQGFQKCRSSFLLWSATLFVSVAESSIKHSQHKSINLEVLLFELIVVKFQEWIEKFIITHLGIALEDIADH